MGLSKKEKQRREQRKVEFPPDSGFYLYPDLYIGKSIGSVDRIVDKEIIFLRRKIRVNPFNGSPIQDSNWFRYMYYVRYHPLNRPYSDHNLAEINEVAALPLVGKRLQFTEEMWDKCLKSAIEEYNRDYCKQHTTDLAEYNKTFPSFIVKNILSRSQKVFVTLTPEAVFTPSYTGYTSYAPRDPHMKFFMTSGNNLVNITGYIFRALNTALTDLHHSKEFEDNKYDIHSYINSFIPFMHWDNSISCLSTPGAFVFERLGWVMEKEFGLAQNTIKINWV